MRKCSHIVDLWYHIAAPIAASTSHATGTINSPTNSKILTNKRCDTRPTHRCITIPLTVFGKRIQSLRILPRACTPIIYKAIIPKIRVWFRIIPNTPTPDSVPLVEICIHAKIITTNRRMQTLVYRASDFVERYNAPTLKRIPRIHGHRLASVLICVR
jgi:hypothetical protein